VRTGVYRHAGDALHTRPPHYTPAVPFDFNAFEAVLLDLDGTVYFEEHALPGAVGLIRRFQAERRKYACLSNSTSNPERVAARLGRMGVKVDPGHIYTAAAAACDYVMERFAAQSRTAASLPKPRVFNLSTEGVHDMLDGRVEWVNDERGPCDAVICGVPVNVFATEERQRTAMLLLRKGAALVAICADRVYPSPRGMEFGVGAMSAMLAYATNVTPVYTGKPERFFFEELCRRLDVAPSRCVLVGDNLESDIAGAKGVGMSAVLVLTGVSGCDDVARLPAAMRPDWVIRGLPDLAGAKPYPAPDPRP
jgi:HAD superfamily hydrolase (TIGR01450 family)